MVAEEDNGINERRNLGRGLSLPEAKVRVPNGHPSLYKRLKNKGMRSLLWLQAEAVVLAKKGMADGVQSGGLPALKVLAKTILSQNIPLWEC